MNNLEELALLRTIAGSLVDLSRELKKVQVNSLDKIESIKKLLDQETEQIRTALKRLEENSTRLYQNQQELVQRVEEANLNYERMLDRNELVQAESKKSMSTAEHAKGYSENAIQTANQVLNSLRQLETDFARLKKNLEDRSVFTENMLTDKFVNIDQAMGTYEYEFENLKKELNKQIERTFARLEKFATEVNEIYLTNEAFTDWKQESRLENQRQEIEELQAATEQLQSRAQNRKEKMQAIASGVATLFKENPLLWVPVGLVVASAFGYREQFVQWIKDVFSLFGG